jgi:S1-C subfamily serine protease
MTERERLHYEVLYPVVRIRTEKAGGSGTIIASLPDSQHEGEYLNFVLTNHHVVDDAIKTRDDWDSLLKRNIRKEFLSPVTVEMFDYVHLSKVDSSDSYRAEIVAYDKHHDIALLRVDSPRKVEHVARLYPKGKERDIKLFTPVWTVGASLLHEPFANPGYITYLSEIIDDQLYWMSNANSIFGNSGGAVFLAETREFIGIPARITGLQLGFGFDVVTWMGFFVPISRIYQFLEEQELQFLYDPQDDYYKAMERRKERQKAVLLEMLSKGGVPAQAEETENIE